MGMRAVPYSFLKIGLLDTGHIHADRLSRTVPSPTLPSRSEASDAIRKSLFHLLTPPSHTLSRTVVAASFTSHSYRCPRGPHSAASNTGRQFTVRGTATLASALAFDPSLTLLSVNA